MIDWDDLHLFPGTTRLVMVHGGLTWGMASTQGKVQVGLIVVKPADRANVTALRNEARQDGRVTAPVGDTVSQPNEMTSDFSVVFPWYILYPGANYRSLQCA